MSIQLQPDEMLDILKYHNHPNYSHMKRVVEDLAQLLAEAVTDVVPELTLCGDASFEGLGFGGTCAPFQPTSKDLKCPEALRVFDIEVQQWEDMQNDAD